MYWVSFRLSIGQIDTRSGSGVIDGGRRLNGDKSSIVFMIKHTGYGSIILKGFRSNGDKCCNLKVLAQIRRS